MPKHREWYIIHTNEYAASVPIFINRTQHFWLITASAMRSWSGSSVFISTSYTKSFVWPQKLKSRGVKSRDRGRHRIGTSQNQSHINADVAPQK
jgi:hypothetical protein